MSSFDGLPEPTPFRGFDGLPAVESSSFTGYAANRIDRRSENRAADAVATAFADPFVRLYLLHADRALTKSADPLFTVAEADALGISRDDAVLLGWAEDGPRAAATVAEDAVIPQTITETDLRSLAVAGDLAPEHLGALAQARSLTHWHARNHFCANCGAQTTMANGGYRRDCPSCGAGHFPRVDPVVIMLAVDAANGGDNCLLGRQPRFMPGMYSCLAGYVEPGETIEDAVRRETFEEAGIRIGRVAYYASQPWPFPSSLMIGCHAEAISRDIARDEAEIEDARWFSRAEARATLAGVHPDGVRAPPPIAIAHHLIRAWAEGA